MSGIPGFHSPMARLIINAAVWVENFYRRRHGHIQIAAGGVVRLGNTDAGCQIGRIGDADERLGFVKRRTFEGDRVVQAAEEVNLMPGPRQ